MVEYVHALSFHIAVSNIFYAVYKQVADMFRMCFPIVKYHKLIDCKIMHKILFKTLRGMQCETTLDIPSDFDNFVRSSLI